MQDPSSTSWMENMYANEPALPPPQQKQRPKMTFDDAIERLESTKISLAMESKDALELYGLQQQVLIGDYYSFDESTIERFASLLEKEQNKAWKKKRGMKQAFASQKFVRLVQEILDFEEIVLSVNESLAAELRDDEYLELQALSQQANVGDNKQYKPKYLPTVNDEVWNAWSSKAGLSQRDARDEYAQKAVDLAEKYGVYMEALSNIKPSSQKNVYYHYHYHLPSSQYAEIPPQEY